MGVSAYDFPNNHIFYTFLAHVAFILFGSEPWVLRLPALFAGVLIVPATYMTVRIFYDKYAAILSAGIIAASVPFIRYSTQARGYTLVCLVTLLVVSLAAYLLRHKNSHPGEAWSSPLDPRLSGF